MNDNRARLFQPRLESLEDRYVPTNISDLFPSMAHLLAIPRYRVFSPAAPPPAHAAVLKLPPRLVIVAPTPTLSSGGAITTGLVVSTNVDSGLATAGLPTTGTSTSDPGLTTPGLPNSAPSQPVTQQPFQIGGLTLNPDGSLSGSLFGSSPSAPTVVPAATPGTSGAVRTLVSTPGLATHTFSLVPQQSSFGVTNQPAPVTVATSFDPGLTTPGLPSYAPSQPVSML